MLKKLKRLGTETGIYGISTIVGRFLNFLLVPFYTNILLPHDYGIITYVFSVIAFINVIYSYGMESAFFKYYSVLEIGNKQENFTTPFISIFSSSIVFSLMILFFHKTIGHALALPPEYISIVYWSAGILALDAITIIPFAYLRMEHKAKFFAVVKFSSILVNVASNLILLLVLKMGVIGVFVSGIIASVFSLIMLLPTIFRNVKIKFNTLLWKELLKFGLPYIPTGLAAMAIQVIDRPILRALTDDATVGVYQANYRLGIFMMLIVSMFEYAWRPFYFSIAKDPDAKKIFARVLTYFVLIMGLVFLTLTFFIDDIAKFSILGRHIIGPKYWGGLDLVPIVLLGYMFLGISTNFSAGIYIEKKTYFTPLITISGALVNIIVNFILIPKYGMFGAALATLAAYFVMSIVTLVIINYVYPVRYEWRRLLKLGIAITLSMVLYYFLNISYPPYLSLLWRFGLILLFLIVLFFLKFFKREELEVLKDILKKFRNKIPNKNHDNQPDVKL